jgi:hypothetical protein
MREGEEGGCGEAAGCLSLAGWPVEVSEAGAAVLLHFTSVLRCSVTDALLGTLPWRGATAQCPG